MASKPLHVRRFQKALQEWLANPCEFIISLLLLLLLLLFDFSNRRKSFSPNFHNVKKFFNSLFDCKQATLCEKTIFYPLEKEKLELFLCNVDEKKIISDMKLRQPFLYSFHVFLYKLFFFFYIFWEAIFLFCFVLYFDDFKNFAAFYESRFLTNSSCGWKKFIYTRKNS